MELTKLHLLKILDGIINNLEIVVGGQISHLPIADGEAIHMKLILKTIMAGDNCISFEFIIFNSKY
jgi:hypothetical protein